MQKSHLVILRKPYLDAIIDGSKTVAWTVNGGEMIAQAGGRVRWRLPDAKGFYQAQVVVDCGTSGIAFDSLNLEVT